MKAIRKSDGRVIEVKEWRGSSDAIYSELDMNAFYQSSDLDFSVNGAKEAEGEVISGWVCRDEDGRIYLYGDEPKRENGKPYGKPSEWVSESIMTQLSVASFPDLTWDDDPMEVEITIKPKTK